jgi:hypothetical protein
MLHNGPRALMSGDQFQVEHDRFEQAPRPVELKGDRDEKDHRDDVGLG